MPQDFFRKFPIDNWHSNFSPSILDACSDGTVAVSQLRASLAS